MTFTAEIGNFFSLHVPDLDRPMHFLQNKRQKKKKKYRPRILRRSAAETDSINFMKFKTNLVKLDSTMQDFRCVRNHLSIGRLGRRARQTLIREPIGIERAFTGNGRHGIWGFSACEIGTLVSISRLRCWPRLVTQMSHQFHTACPRDLSENRSAGVLFWSRCVETSIGLM